MGSVQMAASCFLFAGGNGMAAPLKVAYEETGSASESTSRSSSASELDDDTSSDDSTDRFEMSALMTQLPFKRGLSKFFDGKSQSFASLAAVGSVEDLAKPARKRLKPSWSCEGGLDAHHGRFLLSRRHLAKAAARTAL